jgi:hypothetical protein
MPWKCWLCKMSLSRTASDGTRANLAACVGHSHIVLIVVA